MDLYKNAIAPSSMKLYRTAVNRFVYFCSLYRLSIFPISENKLIYFTAYLSHTISYQSIKSYLSGIRFMAITAGHPIDLHGMDQLYYIIRGIRRTQPSFRVRALRQPISISNLYQIQEYIFSLSATPNHDKRLLWSATLLAFFGLLRSSEYVSPTHNRYSHHSTLLCSNITFASDKSCVRVHIKQSKTDPFRNGCHIRIGITLNSLCPVSALFHFIQHHPF